jgi:hypothetical protein
MLPVKLQAAPLRKDDRVILHFDCEEAVLLGT